MKLPKVTGSGFEKAAIGAAIIAGLFLAYKAYGLLSTGLGAVGDATNAAGEAVGGAVYTALNGDPNANLQSNVQQFLAAWRAAGSPATGSAAETALRQQFGIAPAPLSAAGQG